MLTLRIPNASQTRQHRMPLRHVAPVYSHIGARSLRAAAWAAAVYHAVPTAAELAPLRARYPTKGILLTNSGTSALTLALRATARAQGAGRAPGAGCVALPAYCCPDVGAAAVGAGFRIILYDTDPTTLGPDSSSLERALARGATHVVVTHLYGRPVDVPAVAYLAQRFGAVVIEDAAQHAGASWQGVRAGALAQWSVLSFGRGKGLNAAGGGALLFDPGALTPSPPPLARRWSALRVVLAATAAELLARPAVYWLPAVMPALHLGETRYHEPASVTGPSAANLALLAEALRAEPQVLAERQRIESWYWEQLADHPQLTMSPLPPAAVSGALRFPVRMSSDHARPLARLGVARSYPRTLADYPQLAAYIEQPLEPLPGATALARSLHTLPTHELTTDSERRAIVKAIRLIGP
jgi:dTDP-4-amino-4,6-dideoxygalactose transaminase